MSGGHYDYRYSIMRNLAQDMADEVTDSDEAVAAAKAYCIRELFRVAELARAIEWYMSGDTGFESVYAAHVAAVTATKEVGP